MESILLSNVNWIRAVAFRLCSASAVPLSTIGKFANRRIRLRKAAEVCRHSTTPLNRVEHLQVLAGSFTFRRFCDATEQHTGCVQRQKSGTEQTVTSTHCCHRSCHNKTRFQLVALLGCYAPLITDVPGQRVGLIFKGLLRLTDPWRWDW